MTDNTVTETQRAPKRTIQLLIEALLLSVTTKLRLSSPLPLLVTIRCSSGGDCSCLSLRNVLSLRESGILQKWKSRCIINRVKNDSLVGFCHDFFHSQGTNSKCSINGLELVLYGICLGKNSQ